MDAGDPALFAAVCNEFAGRLAAHAVTPVPWTQLQDVAYALNRAGAPASERFLRQARARRRRRAAARLASRPSRAGGARSVGSALRVPAACGVLQGPVTAALHAARTAPSATRGTGCAAGAHGAASSPSRSGPPTPQGRRPWFALQRRPLAGRRAPRRPAAPAGARCRTARRAPAWQPSPNPTLSLTLTPKPPGRP